MPSLERDDVESSLSKKGFREQAGGDHRYFRLFYGDKDTGIYTKTSRGTGYKSLGNDLVSKMAKQLKLRTGDFVRLIDCSMTYEGYVAPLLEKGEL